MENIHVAFRMRPLNQTEINQNDEEAWVIQGSNTVSISQQHLQEYQHNCKNQVQKSNTYAFDYCFSSEESTFYVYQTSIKNIVVSSLKGINGSIFLYGQSGSGKTYTMMGYDKHQKTKNKNNLETSMSNNQLKRSAHPKLFKQCQKKNKNDSDSEDEADLFEFQTDSSAKNVGILVLSLKDLFETIEKDTDKTYLLRCSYVEIYNDQIFDLLKPYNKMQETLSVGQDYRKEFVIKGVTEESISSIKEVFEVISKGEINRHYAQTTMNHKSSRSHVIFRLIVQSITNNFIRNFRSQNKNLVSNVNNGELINSLANFQKSNATADHQGEGALITESELNFIDLAGSEKVSNHMAESFEQEFNSLIVKERVNEGKHINKSLFFLTQVISLKAEGRNSLHIPYRNSPLTKILKCALGGNSRTLIILCATPAISQMEQTLSTLRFGTNAKKIENQIQVNIQARSDDEAIRLLITEYEKRLRELEDLRKDDKERITYLTKLLHTLTSEKNALKERLVKANRQHALKQFQEQNQSQLLSIDNSQQNRNLNNVQTDSYLKKSIWHTDATGILFHTNKNIACDLLQDNLRNDWQTLIFDFEGKMALQAYKQLKSKFLFLNKQYVSLQANLPQIWSMFLERINMFQKQKQENVNKNETIKYLYQRYNELLEKSRGMHKRLQLLEKCEDIQHLDEQQLVQLELTLLQSYQSVQQEKARRNLETQLQALKQKLEINIKELSFNPIEDSSIEQKSSPLGEYQLDLSKIIAMNVDESDNAIQIDQVEMQNHKDQFENAFFNNVQIQTISGNIQLELQELESTFLKQVLQYKPEQRREYPDLNLFKINQGQKCQNKGEEQFNDKQQRENEGITKSQEPTGESVSFCLNKLNPSEELNNNNNDNISQNFFTAPTDGNSQSDVEIQKQCEKTYQNMSQTLILDSKDDLQVEIQFPAESFNTQDNSKFLTNKENQKVLQVTNNSMHVPTQSSQNEGQSEFNIAIDEELALTNNNNFNYLACNSNQKADMFVLHSHAKDFFSNLDQQYCDIPLNSQFINIQNFTTENDENSIAQTHQQPADCNYNRSSVPVKYTTKQLENLLSCGQSQKKGQPLTLKNSSVKKKLNNLNNCSSSTILTPQHNKQYSFQGANENSYNVLKEKNLNQMNVPCNNLMEELDVSQSTNKYGKSSQIISQSKRINGDYLANSENAPQGRMGCNSNSNNNGIKKQSQQLQWMKENDLQQQMIKIQKENEKETSYKAFNKIKQSKKRTLQQSNLRNARQNVGSSESFNKCASLNEQQMNQLLQGIKLGNEEDLLMNSLLDVNQEQLQELWATVESQLGKLKIEDLKTTKNKKTFNQQ